MTTLNDPTFQEGQEGQEKGLGFTNLDEDCSQRKFSQNHIRNSPILSTKSSSNSFSIFQDYRSNVSSNSQEHDRKIPENMYDSETEVDFEFLTQKPDTQNKEENINVSMRQATKKYAAISTENKVSLKREPSDCEERKKSDDVSTDSEEGCQHDPSVDTDNAFEMKNITFNCFRTLLRHLLNAFGEKVDEKELKMILPEDVTQFNIEEFKCYLKYLYNYFKEMKLRSIKQISLIFSENCYWGFAICKIAERINIEELAESTDMLEKNKEGVCNNHPLFLKELALIRDYMLICLQVLRREQLRERKDFQNMVILFEGEQRNFDIGNLMQIKNRKDKEPDAGEIKSQINCIFRENCSYLFRNTQKRYLQALKRITAECKDIPTFLKKYCKQAEGDGPWEFHNFSTLDQKVHKIIEEETQKLKEYFKKQEDTNDKIMIEEAQNTAYNQEEDGKLPSQGISSLKSHKKEKTNVPKDDTLCVFHKLTQLLTAYLQPQYMKKDKSVGPKIQDNLKPEKTSKIEIELKYGLFNLIFESDEKMNEYKKQEVCLYLEKVLATLDKNPSFNQKVTRKLIKDGQNFEILCRILQAAVSNRRTFNLLLDEARLPRLNDVAKDNIKRTLIQEIKNLRELASSVDGKPKKERKTQKKVKN